MNKPLLSSRRAFLGRMGGLAAAPFVVPASVFASPSPNDRIQVGVIGTGGRGRSLIVDLFQHCGDEARVVALCDVNASHLAKAGAMAAEMYGDDGCASCGDFRELIARADVDAVFIATPEHWHSIPAVAAARARKHLFVEKPLAYTPREGRAIVDAVKQFAVAFQYGTQQRYMGEYHRACMLARNGYLGAVRTVRVGAPFGLRGGSTEQAPAPSGLDYDFWLGPAPYKPYTDGRCDGAGGKGWYHIRDYSGGWITGWGSHDMDIAHWGLGADFSGPTTVSGEAEYDAAGVYDTAWRWRFECAYPNDVTVIFASEDENPHGVRFEGDAGWVFVNRGVIKTEPESLLTVPFKDGDVRLDRPRGHLADFFHSIRTGQRTAAHVDAAHHGVNACHVCNIAAALERPVTWDAAAERFVNDEEANRLLFRAMRPPWGF
ncbi:MAG TPA: Gfo/Idh/MocA family oxidoreductase [Candidatus Hydrogenedentes bacterium]|nr:Gfo/Idh/MocA family oxidoreductase [Candidatus Hydrogenedentota bacterium]